MSKKRYNLDDIPRFSPWPARLLGFKSFPQKKRTESENLREFDQEKWAGLRARLLGSSGDIGLSDVIRWELEGITETLCHNGKSFELLQPLDSFIRYVQLVEEHLTESLPTSTILELGAGYGRVLLSVAEKPAFKGISWYACDSSTEGLELLKDLAVKRSQPVTTIRADLQRPLLTRNLLPPDSLIFTSFALMYAPQLQAQFLDELLALKPKVVVHFEPCYEHCEDTTLWGLLRKKYIELNDYNRNLITLLRLFEAQGRIRILSELPSVFGNHPLISISVIKWSPA